MVLTNCCVLLCVLCTTVFTAGSVDCLSFRIVKTREMRLQNCSIIRTITSVGKGPKNPRTKGTSCLWNVGMDHHYVHWTLLFHVHVSSIVLIVVWTPWRFELLFVYSRNSFWTFVCLISERIGILNCYLFTCHQATGDRDDVVRAGWSCAHAARVAKGRGVRTETSLGGASGTGGLKVDCNGSVWNGVVLIVIFLINILCLIFLVYLSGVSFCLILLFCIIFMCDALCFIFILCWILCVGFFVLCSLCLILFVAAEHCLPPCRFKTGR